MTQKLVSGILVLFMLAAVETAWAQRAAPAATRNAAAIQGGTGDGVPQGYQIGPEDVLHIVVWDDAAMSQTVPVRPDGMISLPLINDVRAAGLTPLQLRDVLMKKLADYMPSPEVSVIVTEVRSFKVSVMGEVNRPTRYELKSSATVLDVLAMAGGFTQFASRSQIVILRPEGKTIKRIPFNYSKVVAGNQEDFYLQPDDIVLVP